MMIVVALMNNERHRVATTDHEQEKLLKLTVLIL
jgi:hypothetical protein